MFNLFVILSSYWINASDRINFILGKCIANGILQAWLTFGHTVLHTPVGAAIEWAIAQGNLDS